MRVFRESMWSLDEGVVLICFSQSWLGCKYPQSIGVSRTFLRPDETVFGSQRHVSRRHLNTAAYLTRLKVL
jgi:hypothetical protein